MSISLVCGAECQIHSVGAGDGAASHWNAISAGNSSTPNVTTSPVRTGTYAFHFAADTTTGQAKLEHEFAASNVAYFRGYFRVADTTPSATNEIGIWSNNISGTNHTLVITTGGVLRLRDAGGGYSSTNDLTLSADTWYGVEIEIDSGANPHTLKWRTWTEAGGWTTSESFTYAVAAATTTDQYIGIYDYGAGGADADWVIYWDDIAMGASSTAGEDYDDTGTNGVDGFVFAYRPTSDGTHTHTLGQYEYDGTGGTDVPIAATDVYSHLDAPDMEQTAESIWANSLTGTTEYLHVNFADEPTYDAPRGVSVVRHVDKTTTFGFADYISDNGTDWTLLVDGVATTSNQFLQDAHATAPSGASWTRSLINSTRARIRGSSAEWYGIALEVEWTSVAALTYAAPDADLATTGWSTSPLWSKVDDDPDSPDGTTVTASV